MRNASAIDNVEFEFFSDAEPLRLAKAVRVASPPGVLPDLRSAICRFASVQDLHSFPLMGVCGSILRAVFRA
jgi:hypothetical protein